MKKLRFNPFADAPPPSSADVLEAAPPQRTAMDEIEGGPPPVTLTVPGYGGITVLGGGTPTEAMLEVLDFLVRHRAAADETLVSYAVLLAQLPQQPTTGFCIRRSTDGWTLAVPAATTRLDAFLQITQALLELARGPLTARMRQAGITPYRE